jgi:hypothetical protein
MAEVNAAYDLLRAGGFSAPPRSAKPGRGSVPAAVQGRGAWLAPAIRRALGRELLEALEDREDVVYVTPTATWASARALLVVTDRRLLWLLDDAPTHRVRALRFRDVAAVEERAGRPLRRSATMKVRTRAGRKLTFADLRPATAAAIARHVAAAT